MLSVIFVHNVTGELHAKLHLFDEKVIWGVNFFCPEGVRTDNCLNKLQFFVHLNTALSHVLHNPNLTVNYRHGCLNLRC